MVTVRANSASGSEPRGESGTCGSGVIDCAATTQSCPVPLATRTHGRPGGLEVRASVSIVVDVMRSIDVDGGVAHAAALNMGVPSAIDGQIGDTSTASGGGGG